MKMPPLARWLVCCFLPPRGRICGAWGGKKMGLGCEFKLISQLMDCVAVDSTVPAKFAFDEDRRKGNRGVWLESKMGAKRDKNWMLPVVDDVLDRRNTFFLQEFHRHSAVSADLGSDDEYDIFKIVLRGNLRCYLFQNHGTYSFRDRSDMAVQNENPTPKMWRKIYPHFETCLI